MDGDSYQISLMTAEERIQWAHQEFGEGLVVSTSFGIQSAVLLHLVTNVVGSVPVVFVDTGFLFEETIEFSEELRRRLGLDLRVFRPKMGPEELIEDYGELWAQGMDSLERYNEIVKLEPMRRAMRELGAKAWLSGIRAVQGGERAERSFLEEKWGVQKISPLLDWSDRQVYLYLKEHALPYHPLWEQGYTSVGDWHSSSPLLVGQDADETRFGGRKRECGLHEKQSG